VSSRYDYDTGGAALGFDKKIGNAFLLGAAAGYSMTKVTMKDLSETGRVGSYQGALYGAWSGSPWYVNGLAAFAYNHYDTSRDISFAGIDRTANAAYGGGATSGFIETGYRFRFNSIQVTPSASFRASYLIRDSFAERDAQALNLNAERGHALSILGSLGVRVSKDFQADDHTITPELRVRWLHEFSNDDYALNASLMGSSGSGFTVQSERPNRDSLALGFGLTCMKKGNVSLLLAYDAIISRDQREHGGSLGVRYRW
jgi:subtilase-type serine protease